MQPARFRQEDILLVEINNAKSMSPAASSGRSAGSFPEQRLIIEPIQKGESPKMTIMCYMNEAYKGVDV